MAQVLDFPVYFEADETGGFVVVCPALPGCYSQGDTLDEAEASIRECIEMCLDAESSSAQGGVGVCRTRHSS